MPTLPYLHIITNLGAWAPGNEARTTYGGIILCVTVAVDAAAIVLQMAVNLSLYTCTYIHRWRGYKHSIIDEYIPVSDSTHSTCVHNDKQWGFVALAWLQHK